MALIELAKGYPEATARRLRPERPGHRGRPGERRRRPGSGRTFASRCSTLADGIPGTYDLITCFDVVHDMPYPRPALRRIRKALAPGGQLLRHGVQLRR